MKTTFIIFLYCFLLTQKTTAQTPLYLSFVSHNETTDPLDYDHPTDPSHYNQIKALATAVCDTIIAKQAKYNMQVDANLIFGCLLHDNAATNPNDLLEWANNSPYIDVDGHNHFNPIQNPYNYADLAYLLDSCGVVLNKNILGGVTWKGTDENWTQYQTPVAGFTFTGFLWQADILWGPATPGHTDDYEAFGIWKPDGPNPLGFGQHNPAKKLTCIGGGCKSDIGFVFNPDGTPERMTTEIVTNLKALADYINSIPPQPNAFFTSNMLINFRDFTEVPDYADSIAAIIDGVQDYVAEGKIVWLTLAEKHALWLATHPNPADFFIYQCDDVVLTSTGETPLLPAMNLSSNPAHDQVTIRMSEQGTKSVKFLI